MTIGNSVGLFVFLSQWLSSFLLSAKQFLFMNRNALIVVFFVFTIVFFVVNLVDLRQEVYVFASVYVCLFVCLFVCVQHSSKSYESILMKFSGINCYIKIWK